MTKLGRSLRLVVGLLIGVLVGAGGLLWLLPEHHAPPPAPDEAASADFAPLPPRALPPAVPASELIAGVERLPGPAIAPPSARWFKDEHGKPLTGLEQVQRATERLPQQATLYTRTVDVAATRQSLLKALQKIAGRPVPIPSMPTDLSKTELVRGLYDPKYERQPTLAAAWLLNRLRVADVALAARGTQPLDDLLNANTQLSLCVSQYLNRPDLAAQVVDVYLLPYIQYATLPPTEQGSAYVTLDNAAMLYRAAHRPADEIWALTTLIALAPPDGRADQARYMLAEVHLQQHDPAAAAAQLKAITQPDRFPLTARIADFEAQARHPSPKAKHP